MEVRLLLPLTTQSRGAAVVEEAHPRLPHRWAVVPSRAEEVAELVGITMLLQLLWLVRLEANQTVTSPPAVGPSVQMGPLQRRGEREPAEARLLVARAAAAAVQQSRPPRMVPTVVLVVLMVAAAAAAELAWTQASVGMVD